MVLHFQLVHDRVSRFTAFGDCRYHQIRTTHDITTGKDFRVAGLEGVIAAFWLNHTQGLENQAQCCASLMYKSRFIIHLIRLSAQPVSFVNGRVHPPVISHQVTAFCTRW